MNNAGIWELYEELCQDQRRIQAALDELKPLLLQELQGQDRRQTIHGCFFRRVRRTPILPPDIREQQERIKRDIESYKQDPEAEFTETIYLEYRTNKDADT